MGEHGWRPDDRTPSGDGLEDEVVLVTGGTRNIGRAITTAFATRGATVVAGYHSDGEAAAETEALLADAPGGVSTVQFDVRDHDEVARTFDEVEESVGGVTVLVNNAGINRPELVVRTDPDDWAAMIETNLTGTFNCTRRVVRSMLRADGGSIVNVSSVAATSSWPGQAAYIASKAGIEGFTRAVARELGGRDVRINAVAPGLIESEQLAALEAGGFDNSGQSPIPQDRKGDPAEVAECVAFLASDRASYVNGELLRIDGGQLA